MYDDSSEARERTAWARSSEQPRRGTRLWRESSSATSGGQARSKAGVRIGPGDTALQRMPLRPYCVATESVRVLIAAFAAAYAVCERSPASDWFDEALMIEPPPAASMWGMAYLQARKT